MDIQINPSTPQDVAEVVPLIYSSGPAAFDYVFAHPKKGSAPEFLAYAFKDGAGEFGYRNHTSVFLDGALVGAGAAYSGDTTLPFTLAAARQILKFYGLIAGVGVIVRGLKVESLINPPTGKIHYLAHLGVAPTARGKGVGRALIEHLLAQGRAKGRKIAALDVSVENPRAQALYERLGFTVAKENISSLKREDMGIVVVDHRKMEFKL